MSDDGKKKMWLWGRPNKVLKPIKYLIIQIIMKKVNESIDINDIKQHM